MNILILGGAGFIGTNLTLALSKNEDNNIYSYDKSLSYFDSIKSLELSNVHFGEINFDEFTNYDDVLQNIDVVYHLISTNIPGNSNSCIKDELNSNISPTLNLLDSCVRNQVKKVVFLSSGGAIYGKCDHLPLDENEVANPISSYGLQKLMVENILRFYHNVYNLDYKIIRLSNPYGPYQKTNGVQGALTNFIFRAIHNDEIVVYGDGSVTRDYIFIDDAIQGIINIANDDSDEHLFNLGSGKGLSLNDLINAIEETLNLKTNIKYIESRKIDVPINYLNISRYVNRFGNPNNISISDGIKITSDFLLAEKGK